MSDPLSIQFIATLAGVNTAAKPVSFDIDGAAKISLETDESQTPNVVALMALKRARLIVNVTVDPSQPGDPAPETGTKRRKKRGEAAVIEADTTTTAVAVPNPDDAPVEGEFEVEEPED